MELGSFFVGAFLAEAPRADEARVVVDRERVAVPLVRDVPLVLVAMGSRYPRPPTQPGNVGRVSHLPSLTELEIPGVFAARSPVVAYNSSLLVEPYREGWSGLYNEPLGHLYWIVTHPGVVRKWGRHQRTIDRYSAVFGTLEVALVDGREDSPTSGEVLVVPLDAEKGDGLLIPVGVWHTFRALSPTAVLLNSKSPGYDPEHLDKELLPMPNDQFDFVWND